MNKKIKVLYIVSTLRRCGPTNQLFNIVSNLDNDMFEGLVLTLSNESSDTLKPKFDAAGIRVASLELGRLSGVFFGWSKLKRKVKEFVPDVIHTQGIRADRYAVRLMEFGIKTVATIRCIPTEDYPMKYGRFLGMQMAKKHLGALEKLDVVASVSKSIKKSLLAMGLTTTAIQNGCDLSKYKCVSDNRKKELRDQLAIPHDKIILISVGHLSNRKDPLTLIKAFKAIPDRSRFQLLFIGDGELRNECESEVSEESGIRLIGRVENVDEYLQASDVFLSASLSEGLPNTVLESLSCGIPTILSNIPQHMEVFDGYMDRYTFFSIGNIDELTTILDNLSLEYLGELPTRSIVEDNFDSQKMSGAYQSIYKKLIS